MKIAALLPPRARQGFRGRGDLGVRQNGGDPGLLEPLGELERIERHSGSTLLTLAMA